MWSNLLTEHREDVNSDAEIQRSPPVSRSLPDYKILQFACLRSIMLCLKSMKEVAVSVPAQMSSFWVEQHLKKSFNLKKREIYNLTWSSQCKMEQFKLFPAFITIKLLTFFIR